MIVGLTGPIAAGKNEVVKILRRRGAEIVEVDEVAHALYNPQSPVWRELVKTFGSRILVRGGKINRKKLGEIVFSDKNKLKELNSIVHPYLKEEIIKKTESCQSSVAVPAGRQVSCKLIVINAAVLKEIGLADYVDEVWVVMASKETRLKRLVKAGFSKAEAQKRLKAQALPKEYLKMADVVIQNDGTLKQLNAKVQACL